MPRVLSEPIVRAGCAMGARASAPLRRKRGSEAPSPSAEGPLELAIISDPGEDLCGNQPVCRAGDGVAALVPSSGEELISRRWRGRAGSVGR